MLNKNNLTNSVSENIEIENSNFSSISDNSEEKKKNEKSEIKVEEESRLTNFSEFDFIDFGETEEDLEEEEEETDVFDDSALSASSDPVVQAVGAIFMLQKLLSLDIHAEPLENKMRIRYRIDGVLKKHILSQEKARAIVSRIKVMSKLDSREKTSQDGRIR